MNKLLSIFFATTVACAAAHADTYPSKPVHLIVGFSAGGGTDLTARILARRLSESLARSVVVENKPGSGGLIGATSVAKSAPDGYTLLMSAAADVVQPAIRKSMPFNLKEDLSPISLVVKVPFLLVVHPVVPAKTAKDLIAIAKTKPGILNYASSGVGSSAHLSNELFNAMAHIKVVHVPYKGVSRGVTALAGGQVDMLFSSVPAAYPLVESGRLRALGISTLQRLPLLPNIPTIDESGLPGYERYGWYGVQAPAGTPNAIIVKLHEAIAAIVDEPGIRNAYLKQGLLPETSTPQEFARFIAKELDKTARLVKLAGVKPR